MYMRYKKCEQVITKINSRLKILKRSQLRKKLRLSFFTSCYKETLKREEMWKKKKTHGQFSNKRQNYSLARK